MKKIIFAVAGLAALGASPVFAQAQNFQGLSLGANYEYNRGSFGASDGSSGHTSGNKLGLQARYDWAVDNNFVVGVGTTIGTGDRVAGTYASGAQASTSNRYSLDLTPGYAVNNNLLVFGKLSAVSAKVNGDDGASSVRKSGTGVGLGVRGLVDKNVFWQAGVDRYHYDDATFATGTTAGLKDSVVSLGVGYKF